MKPNIELMKRLVTRFRRMRHKQHFYMKTVAMKTECGTAMCIAGHVLDLQGYKFKFPRTGGGAVAYTTPQGKQVRYPLETAARELGLDYDDDAFYLFHDFNIRTPKQAASRIEELIAERSQ